MVLEKGNQIWKLRSKHGRNRLFASADLMWKAACEYFQWCDDNPFMETDFRGKDAKEVKLPKMRPYTIHGLCVYLRCHSKYFYEFEDSIKDRTDDESNAFRETIIRIKEIIYNQKFSGAAAGFFNANIIARDLGLTDKTSTHVHVEQPLFKDE